MIFYMVFFQIKKIYFKIIYLILCKGDLLLDLLLFQHVISNQKTVTPHIYFHFFFNPNFFNVTFRDTLKIVVHFLNFIYDVF